MSRAKVSSITPDPIFERLIGLIEEAEAAERAGNRAAILAALSSAGMSITSYIARRPN